MKIGIIVNTRGYQRFGDEKYKKLKKHGYCCGDFDLSDTDKGAYIMEDAQARDFLMHEKKLALEAGIEISQVHGPWGAIRPEVTPQGRVLHMENMKKALYFASVIGSKNLVIHPLMPFGTEEAGTASAKETWDINVEFLGELAMTAEKYDVTLCLENMPMLGFSLSKPSEILRIVEAVDNPYLKICLDTGHVATFKELKAGDVVREIGKQLRTLHVHDSIAGYDLHLAPFCGVTDWADFAKALNEIDFEGAFSLETQPSPKLSDALFEDMGTVLAGIAKEISGSALH